MKNSSPYTINPFFYIYEEKKETCLINLISCDWFKIKKKLKNKLDQKIFASKFTLSQTRHIFTSQTLNKLLNEKLIITTKEYDDIFLFINSYLTKAASSGQKEIIFTLISTKNCNLACPYCIVKNSKQSISNKSMDKKMVEAAFDCISLLLADKKKARGGYIDLYGGEPLLIPSDILEQIFYHVKKLKLKLFIPTNGLLVKKHLSLFVKYRSNIKGIKITIDGPPHIHNKRRTGPNHPNTFFDMIEAVDLLIANKIKTTIRINIDKQNIDCLEKLYQILKKKKYFSNPCLYWDATVTTSLGKDSPDYFSSRGEMLFHLWQQKLSPDFKKIITKAATNLTWEKKLIDPARGKFFPQLARCGAIDGSRFAFAPDGKIYNCEMLIGEEEFQIGTFHPAFSLDNQKMVRFKKRLSLNLPKCKNCQLKLICSGGCLAESYFTHQNIFEPVCNVSFKDLEKYLKIGKNVKRNRSKT